MKTVKSSRRKTARVKTFKRKKKGGGYVTIKGFSRKGGAVKAHKAADAGKAKKVRNSVGRVVYAKSIKK